MRKRLEIESDPKPYNRLSLEVLLDIRGLLAGKPKESISPEGQEASLLTVELKKGKRKRGRPKKTK